MLAFAGMPKIEFPAYCQEKKPRIFELRTYESHSELKALKKVEMFNAGEIDLMREVGLAPIFYGQALIGRDLPHLTYMLSAENQEAHKKHWNAFGASHLGQAQERPAIRGHRFQDHQPVPGADAVFADLTAGQGRGTTPLCRRTVGVSARCMGRARCPQRAASAPRDSGGSGSYGVARRAEASAPYVLARFAMSRLVPRERAIRKLNQQQAKPLRIALSRGTSLDIANLASMYGALASARRATP